MNNIDMLETKRLILRKAAEKDLLSIWKNIWSDKSIADNMLWEVTDSINDAKDRLNRTIKYQSENYAYFVCLKEKDEPIGFAGIYEKEPNVFEETGICIATKYQGKGYGKEVVAALKELIFEKLNGKKFIYGCFSTNVNSKKLCLSQGFRYMNSEEKIREHDQLKCISDYYYFDSEMYNSKKGSDSNE